MDTRTCKSCEKTFPRTLEFFRPSKSTSCKLDIYCRGCRREYARKWYSKNREKEIARCTKWNKENPEKVAANMAKLRSSDPDHFRDYMRQYRKSNPDYVRFHDALKRAKRRMAINATNQKLTRKEYIELVKKARGKCFYCGKKERLTIDHIIPLSKGGSHSRDNIVMACTSCNSSKGSRDPNKFAQKHGRLFP